MLNETFKTANDAFDTLYDRILIFGTYSCNDTKFIRNCGFTILNPLANKIAESWREWSERYAQREWDWYLSKDRSVKELKRYAPIWDTMHKGDDIVNSNYGYLWNQNNQLNKVIDMLIKEPNTRRAWITLYDGKNIDEYAYDSPCTIGIGFYVEHSMLHMQVIMRSNDLIFGFCNDQYCFSKLMHYVSTATNYAVGTYYHYAANMHIYNKHLNLKKDYYEDN